jgi:hypothetical protein
MSCCDDGKAKGGSQASGLRGLVTGPRRWWLFGAVGVAAGLTFGWEQLVLFGIAPILISLLPCLVMCGLGLCMMKCKDKKGDTSATTEQQPATMASSTPSQADTAVAQAGPDRQAPAAIALNKSI